MSDDQQPEYVQIPRGELRELRRRARRASKLRRTVPREAAMLRAGVDLDSPRGQLFVEGFDGDFDDVAAVREAAIRVGAVADETD